MKSIQDIKRKIQNQIKQFADLVMKGNTLYYPGCLTKYGFPELKKKYIKLLQKLRIEFIEIDEIACCGSPSKNSGNVNLAKKLAIKNLKILNEYGVTQIITSCPACYNVFANDYPKLLKKNWRIKVSHIVQVIADKIKSPGLDEELLNREYIGAKMTYHDPCHLGRYSGIYEEPRKIIQSVGKLREMKLARENSWCCGGGGGVRNNAKEISAKSAIQRVQMAEDTKADCLVTACPMCLAQFNSAIETLSKEREKPDGNSKSAIRKNSQRKRPANNRQSGIRAIDIAELFT